MQNRERITWLLAGALALLQACAHTPGPEERKQAAAEYKVGLSLVHEAQEAAREGALAKQDYKYREALEALLKAERLDPQNAEAQYLLGLVYFVGFKRHGEAELHLQNAMKVRNEPYPEAENLLGNILVDAGRPEDALRYYQSARANLLYRTPYFAEEGYGWALFQLGRLDEAAKHLRTALVAQPDLCGGYVKLAEIEESRGQLGEATSALESFLSRCDSDRLRANVGTSTLAYAYFRLGMAHLKAGKKAEASEALRICAARFGTESVASECDKSLRLMN